MSKFTWFFPLLLGAACGGSSPPAEAPKPAESAADKPAAKPKAEEQADTENGKPDKAEAEKPEAKKPDDSPKPTRSLQDILTASDVVFMLSFNDSDIKQAAETKCSASSGNDPKKMNACMAKAHKGVEVDGYRFKEVDGKLWWFTLRTQGRILHTIHKFEIEFGPEQDKSITIKPKGKDMGSAHGRPPTSVTIQVPNEYQIAINDPKLGKLVYEAKIGTASDAPGK
jgi:outer membrane biosynthesis protein TonB